MKTILYFVLFFLGIASIGITIIDIVNNSYYKEFDNIKSLKNKEEYMTIDYLLIKKTHDRNEATADGIRFDIEGVLMSNGSPSCRTNPFVWFMKLIWERERFVRQLGKYLVK